MPHKRYHHPDRCMAAFHRASTSLQSQKPVTMKRKGTCPTDPSKAPEYDPPPHKAIKMLTDFSQEGIARLGGRRRDQERELRRERGRSWSGRCGCSPEVFKPGCGSILGSWAPSARLRRPE
ncbi:hypothetical protein H8959_004626 [Pygathrix nigripes]